MRSFTARLGIAVVLAFLAGPFAARAEVPAVALSSPDLVARARAVALNGELELTEVVLPGHAEPKRLRLERFEVVVPEARIVVHGHDGDYEIPFPRDLHFRGGIDGDPNSLAVLAVQESGAVHGFLTADDKAFTLGQNTSPRGEQVSPRVEEAQLDESLGAPEPPWGCGSEMLATPPDPFDFLSLPMTKMALPEATTTRYEVDIAFDTDYEFWALFGDDAAAASYVTTLAAGASAIYDRDVNAVWRVARIDLYNGGPTLDPWQQWSSHCGLFEVGNYWQANRSAVVRDLVHFLSGKNYNAGIAWVGVLCSGDIACSPTTENCGAFPSCSPTLPDPSYAGGYALSAGIDGNYTGSLVWDIVVVTHEGGHNFSSPHTHCYGNYPNAGEPVVDQCYNGAGSNPNCWAGAESLPADGGSIMSYCHTLPGGLSNLNLYLGRASYYGTNSERVQNRIRAEIEANTWCLDEVSSCSADPLMTVTGTESGTVTHEACTQLVYTAFESLSSANVTGSAPLIELEDDTTLSGTVALNNTVP